MVAALPKNLDEDGFYGIRLESIGGLGAHLAGQILAEAGVLRLGLNGSHFSSYGSEKKGTPLKSYIRFCSPDQTVRTNSADGLPISTHRSTILDRLSMLSNRPLPPPHFGSSNNAKCQVAQGGANRYCLSRSL